VARKSNIAETLKGTKFKPLTGSSTVIWEKAGQSVTGIYQGHRVTTYENRPVNVHRISTPQLDKAGDPITLEIWESSALKNLGLLDPGTVLRITYNGMRKSKRGGRKYKDFLIEIDETVSVDVPAREGSKSKGRKRGR
jgi:hypothetical protein